VTAKLAELAPAATCTDAGMINAVGTLLASVIPVELAAVCESVTVQLADVAALSVVLSHCSAEMPGVPAAFNVMDRDLLEAPMVAVRLAI